MAPWVIWPMCPMGFPSCVLPGAWRPGGIAVVALGHRFPLPRRPCAEVLARLGQFDLVDVGPGRRPVLVGGNGVPDDRGLRPDQYGVDEAVEEEP